MSTEQFKVNIKNTGSKKGLSERQKSLRDSVVLRPPTLSGILEAIDALEISEEIKEEIKKVARSYPNQAYPYFVRNFTSIVARVQNARRDLLKTYSVKKRDLNECGENPSDKETQEGNGPSTES